MKKLRRSLRFLLLMGMTILWMTACSGSLRQTATTDSQSAECRTIQHAMGESCVPAHPQRVVALTGIAAANLLSLEIQPVGVISNLADILKEKLQEVERVGHDDQPNLETILALQPDLILTSKWSAEGIYDRLSQIAPTVVDDMETTSEWKAPFALHAKALGMTGKAEQLMARYNQRVQDLRQAMGPRLQETEVSLTRIYADQILLYLKNSFGGAILEEVGFPRPPAQDEGVDGQPPFLKTISKESLQAADGDVIFLWSFGATPEMAQAAQATLQQLKSDPLWLQLRAVQQGRVYEVGHYWNAFGSPLTANLVLNDLFKHLVTERKYRSPHDL